jgi:hypothetical protein
MSHIAQQFGHSLLSFARDDEGAQVVEYALIIAVVSIALVLLSRHSPRPVAASAPSSPASRTA